MFFTLYLIQLKKPFNELKQLCTISYGIQKPAKIKREILTMDYEKGGLKIIDLETIIKSLKYVG